MKTRNIVLLLLLVTWILITGSWQAASYAKPVIVLGLAVLLGLSVCPRSTRPYGC
jgi:uncharacterized membrane protein